ncbi:MAG: EFR1 family ferrodoxin [Pelosinus sp.]|nr:EFR1 family ferrodoxin [Pelosinus sp.]
MFEKVAIFFMTGTGNSYKIAAWFAEIAEKLGLAISMQQIKRAKLNIAPDGKTLCVFTLPTHGFTTPWLVVKQILHLPRGSGAAAVVLPSRAGTRIKGVSLPGMEGTAGYLAACLLFFKGYKVRGVMGVDMPSNWTALHWGLSKENAEFIIAAAKPRVQHFTKMVLAGKVYFASILPLIIGIWLAPVSFGYLVVAQFMLSKLFFASDKCAGCGLCARICPKQAITMTGKRNQRPYWTYACDSCMACMNYCPAKAVEASPILAIVFYYLTTIPAAAYLLNSLCKDELAGLLLNWGIVQYIYILTSIFLAYLILHTTLGWRYFSMLLSRLSHTYYFRRYHAPDVTVKDINRK